MIETTLCAYVETGTLFAESRVYFAFEGLLVLEELLTQNGTE